MIDTNRSKQLWAICSRFNLLPNDPRLQDLTPFQVVWIIANMNAESAQQKKELEGGQERYTIDPNDFDEGTFRALEALAQNGNHT